MLKLGNKNISKFYFRNKGIGKAYLGTNLVFESAKPIFIDYIESTGRQWIDTGIKGTDVTRFVVKGTCIENGVNNTQLIGGNNSSSQTFFGNRYTNNVAKWYCVDSKGTSIGNPHNLSIIDATIESGTSQYGTLTDVVEGTVSEFIKFSGNAWGFPESNLLIFGGYSSRRSPNATCYLAQLYTTDGLVRDLRPCLKGNTPCMYDMVTKQYFYNQGTGEFIAGPKINFVDYIIFDGKSWIDTGITELGGTWTVTASGDDSTQLRFLIGNGGQAANYYGALSNGKWGLGTASEEYYFENARTSKMTAEVIFEESQATATVDGVTLVRPGTKATGNFLLCGYQSLDTSNYLFKGNVYHCSYVDITGKLILDLYPVIDPSGIVCMFDKVTHTYYYNQGSGKFGYSK